MNNEYFSKDFYQVFKLIEQIFNGTIKIIFHHKHPVACLLSIHQKVSFSYNSEKNKMYYFKIHEFIREKEFGEIFIEIEKHQIKNIEFWERIKI